jgi:hypothetical protein
MSVELKISDAGNLDAERVVVMATAHDDIGLYAIFQCKSVSDDKISPGDIPRAYWFADAKIKKGDFIVLYTKHGVTREKKNKDGSTSRFFYWGAKEPLWVPGMTAVLVRTSDWQFSEASASPVPPKATGASS